MSDGATIVYALIGGLIPEFVRVYGLRDKTADLWPEYLRRRGYWVITALMILAGAGLAKVYLDSGVHFSPFLAINVGASAPVLLRGLITTTPTITPGTYN